MLRQRTLRTAIRATGAGLHSGARADVILRPAEPGTGIVFRRVDLPESVEIPARIEQADSSLLSITLRRGDLAVSAVEHLLAAATGLGIDNMYVDITGPEVPTLDGSASPFVFLIQSAGVQEQGAPRRFIRILRPVQINEGDAWARLAPHDGLRIALWTPSSDSPTPAAELEVTETSFIKEVSRARSSNIRQPGSGRGGLTASRGTGSEGPDARFEDEDSRSRILTALGALSLLGASTVGTLEGCGSTQVLHLRLLRALLAEPDAWDETPPGEGVPPAAAVRAPSVA